MKAKLPASPVHNGRNYANEKETVSRYAIVAVRNGRFCEPVTARCYMGRARTATAVYASIWLSDGRCFYASGHGMASGYGYHKESAAIAYAIKSAGVTLSEDISGRGDRAMEDALAACARALGFRKFHLVRG